MSRKDRLANIDPLGDFDGEQRSAFSMEEADSALFGELSRREVNRQTVRPVSIFDIFPDVKQPRRAIPLQVRGHWSGEPKEIADLFNAWLTSIGQERKRTNRSAFNLDHYLWAESIEKQLKAEDEISDSQAIGPMEKSFLEVVNLAVSIRRDRLANPVTIQHTGGSRYVLETGERRWLSYHMLHGYFDGSHGKPNEQDLWSTIPAIVVDEFSVWRQASENNARENLNAIGRARQYAILMIDLLTELGEQFTPFEELVKPGQYDRAYYAQVIDYRVPRGKGEQLSNGLGVSHRSAFTRCRTLLSLPDKVWLIGDNIDLPEDELLNLARLPEKEAIARAERLMTNVATRNIKPADKTDKKPPTLFADPALKRGKSLFSREKVQAAKEIFAIREGVSGASSGTKLQLRNQIDELRKALDKLEQVILTGGSNK